MEPIIKVENIGKQYRLGNVGTGTLSHDLNRWWQTSIRGKDDPYLQVGETNDRTQSGGSEYVWALQDINFEVQPGEILGIIGKNGAGKSTLLKLLSRVTAPTTGKITSYGRIASLLEVGTGFHPELTGKENVYLNGAILGMTKKEIAAKYDEIVDFAGCAKYMDTPVKRYSSGMRVRLGFAVAAFLEPDILVVDEVLAVGDAEFQKKAIGKMQDVSQGQGRTVLFVSHNMPSIERLCQRVIVMNNGKVDFNGGTSEGIQFYLKGKIDYSNISMKDRKDRIGSGLLKFVNIDLFNNNILSPVLQTGSKAVFKVHFEVKTEIKNIIFRLIVVDKDYNFRFVCNNHHSSEPIKSIENSGSISLIIENLPLPEGDYFYHLQALINKEVADEIEFAGEFKVEPGDFFKTGKTPIFKKGLFINHKWEDLDYGK